jgi:hypothetical protein
MMSRWCSLTGAVFAAAWLVAGSVRRAAAKSGNASSAGGVM